MIEINKLNESWIHLSGDVDDILSIKEHFKFRPENYQFNPKYRSGVWSGWIYLMDKYNRLPIGLYMRLKKLLKTLNIEYTNNFTKTSVNISDESIIKFSKDVLKMNIDLRDYQLEAIRESFKQQKAIVLSPTASGKSAILFLIAMLFLKLKPKSKVLLIVPNVSLVDQMKGDFLEYSENMDDNIDSIIHTIYSGKEKVNNKKIIISTWQSLATIKDKSFFEAFGLVEVDEIQSAEKGVVLQNIIQSCTNAEMKIGVSGTINDEKLNRVQLEGLFGKINQFTTTKKLMKEGTLSDLNIKVLVLKYNNDDRRSAHKLPYPDEMKFLVENKSRLNLIVKTATKINNKNVLVLFKNLDYGKQIYERLVKLNPDRKVHYVAGTTKATIREEIRKIAIDDTNGIICASFGVFAAGINIPPLDYIIFAQPSKSKIRVVQSIGRVLRKAKGKNKAVLIDLVDDLVWRRRKNFAMKHGMSRLEIYDREGFRYSVTEIDLK